MKKIFVDFVLPPDALTLLRTGTAEHELIFPEKPATSVLATGDTDPRFAEAEIAFGQPDPAAIASSANLRWIQLSTSSIERYDNAAFRATLAAREILFCNSASVYAEACATHALSFLLAQARRLPLALTLRTPGGSAAWHALRASSVPLEEQTVAIIGYGAIGQRLVELLAPFRMKIMAYRRHARGDESVPVLTLPELEHALATEVDHIVNILPANPETRHFFDATRFAKLKAGAVFYNIGRGATVDQNALADALHAERLAAAWLDVTEPEPLPDEHPLWAAPNCFITPHVAGGHAHESITLVRHFLRNLERFERGEPLADSLR